MNDSILLLLMHECKGLTLEPVELSSILKAGEIPSDELEAKIISKSAREYIDSHPYWARESLEILKESSDEGIRWSRLGLEDYPREWLTLSEKPSAFNYLGSPSWMHTPMLAVVGSRTPMQETRMWMQRELTRFLFKTKVGIVSGGARGIDQWAHRLALDCGRPTVCILPAGILNRYPPNNEPFWKMVLEQGGCLLSTLSLHEPMRKHAFHVRNRWIAGFSRLVFVAEANRRSGSSMTAQLAGEEGRDLCTLPVFPHSEQGLGNLDIIIGKNGTILRDWMDLEICWQKSNPGLFQATNGESKKQGVDQPQSDSGVQPTVTGDTLGREIENPVGHQQHQANHEAATL